MFARVLLLLLLACLSACASDTPTPTAMPIATATMLPTPAAMPTEPRAEVRAFWVDAFHPGIKSPQEVAQLITDMRVAHVNTIFAQVRKRGDAYFNKTIEPRADELTSQPDYDPLAYLIAQAHAATPRIEVHAWINAMTIANATEPPTSTLHVFTQHGPDAKGDALWLSQNVNGGFVSDNSYFLDPGHPAAAQHTIDVCLNVARNYDVDGIHLDFIRYAGAQWGYNPASVARFDAQYHRSGQPAPKDADWMQWRRDRVSALVRQVYLEAIAIKPNVKVSAALIAWGAGPTSDAEWQRASATTDVFQDWQAWLQEGILDMAVPMNYDRERNPQHKEWFDRWIGWEKEHHADRHLVIGIGAFLNDIDDTLAQTQRARAPSSAGQRAQGVSFYAYAARDARDLLPEKFFRALTQSDSSQPLFADVARAPEMAWKTKPTLGHLKGFARYAADRPADGLTITVSGPITRTLIVSGMGFFGAANLPPGAYTLSVARGDSVLATATATVVAGVVTTVDFAAVH